MTRDISLYYLVLLVAPLMALLFFAMTFNALRTGRLQSDDRTRSGRSYTYDAKRDGCTFYFKVLGVLAWGVGALIAFIAMLAKGPPPW